MRYGFPYRGSKNKIAESIINLFPKADKFYDLFAGGGAITHCALLSDKFNHIIMNDINSQCVSLFKDIVDGNLPDRDRFISREEFFKYKEEKPFIKYFWSFGSNGFEYIYGSNLENYKRVWHNAIYNSEYEEAKRLLSPDIECIDGETDIYKKYLLSKKFVKFKSLQPLDDTNGVFRLAHLEREYRLQHIERTINIVKDFYKLKNLPIEYNSKSYDEIEISENSIIYCDIPYANSESYDCRNKNTFTYDKFYDWCLKQDSLVFVSEYNMPESEFIPIWEKCKTSSFSATNNSLKTIEKVFIPKHQKDKYFKSLNDSQHNLF